MNLRRGAQHVLVVIAGVAAVGLAGVPGIVSRSASTLRGMEEPVQSQTASPPTGEVAGSGTRVATNESQLAVVPPRFTLPDGFVIEQVAGPPLVRYPLFGCFDDAGHLYVAEGTGQSVPGPELLQQPLGRIVRLEDTDNDGKFDKSTLFADGLVFPQGVLWHDGVVYVASHPAIWRLEDTDGDGCADRREEFVAGFNFSGNGCDIHGPFLGPDGRLYWTDGRHGYQIDRPDGTHLEGLASRIWRCRTDGRELERFAGGGFDNPVEVAWTIEGEMLGTMDQGAGDCLLHYIEGGVYPEEHPCVQEFPRTGPLLGVARRYSVELPAALCGTMRFRSTGFGPEFRDTLMTAHYMTHKLVRSTLVSDGSTFRAEDVDFLVSSDPHLRLTDVLEDADGSLLAIDMGAWFTYGFLGNVLPRPDMLGAIYRIRRSAAPPGADPRGMALRLTERSVAALIALLDDPRPAVRDRAVDRLAKLAADSVAALETVLRSGERSVEARCNAVWTLCRIDGPEARGVIRQELVPLGGDGRKQADESNVRTIAAYSAGLHRDEKAVAGLIEVLKSDHLPLRRKAAEALGRIGRSEAVLPLLDALRLPVDRFLEHSLIYSLIQINDREAVRLGLSDACPQVQKAALIALDQMQSGKLTRGEVVPLLASSDATLQQAALNVISRRPAWADAAHGVLREWLASPQLTADQQKSLAAFLSAGSANADIQGLAGAALASSDTPVATRALLIDVARQSGADPLPVAWVDGLARVLSEDDPTLSWEALAAVRTRGWRQFDEVVRSLSNNERLTAEIRVAALECLSAARQSLDAEAFDFLTDQLSETTAPLLRLAAARTLGASPLSKSQLLQVAGHSRQVSTMILRVLLPLFAASNDAEVGASIVEALQASPAAEGLTAAELDSYLMNYPLAVRQQAARLRAKIVVGQHDKTA